MQFDRLFESKTESTAESKAECGAYFTVVTKREIWSKSSSDHDSSHDYMFHKKEEVWKLDLRKARILPYRNSINVGAGLSVSLLYSHGSGVVRRSSYAQPFRCKQTLRYAA